jgi:hypothetical protein
MASTLVTPDTYIRAETDRQYGNVVTAGVLRGKFTVNWNKDREMNQDGSQRFNDVHLTRAEKEAAQERSSGPSAAEN